MPSDPAASVTPEAIPLFLQPPADEPADDQLTLF
jgi:hypothetical protein